MYNSYLNTLPFTLQFFLFGAVGFERNLKVTIHIAVQLIIMPYFMCIDGMVNFKCNLLFLQVQATSNRYQVALQVLTLTTHQQQVQPLQQCWVQDK